MFHSFRAGAVAFAAVVCGIGSNLPAQAPAKEPRVELLWPAGAPGALGTEEGDKPSLTVHLPARANGAAVVICPGGGYGHLAVDHEGKQVGEWLNSLGVTAFMLKYRLAPKYKHPAPLQDAQRAIRTVRARAAEWNVDAKRVGILGFSAGGHLASTAATHFDNGLADAKDGIDKLGCRPDFAILCYPVISFTTPFTHVGSRNNLLGKDADARLVESLSNELQVTGQTPPTFLFHTNEDSGVPPENSVLFYMALRKAKVPAELHIYEKGKHGVGLAQTDPALSTWPARCADWLKGRNLLKLVAADPARVADPDFLVQGEYTGEVETKDGKLKAGAQVIALGEGKFRLAAYRGGLPGDGWDKSERIIGNGETKGGVVISTSEKGGGRIANGILTILNKNGDEVGKLSRIERHSPTLGATPPAGAIVLFDGTSVVQFDQARLSMDGLLIPAATSKRKFQNCTLHVEFRTPYQPQDSGQARGNSGVYLQGRYEVQILDSFGLDGKNNECGGIYTIKDPDVNMCFPPLAWQTYDIDYTAAVYDAAGKKTKNATITVRHNGVVVHKDVELTKATTAAPVPEGPEPGPIYLQDHGNPVLYRNIWLVEKK